MARATVGAGGIEYIQGALKKPKKQDGHKHGNYVIMTHRTAATTNPECQRIYVKEADAYKRTTPLTQREHQIRNRFIGVRAMVAERSHDLSKITTDQQTFIAQKNEPNGCKTMKQWYWKICGAEWDQQHS